MMNRETILDILRQEKLVLEKEYFILKVGLFGSFAVHTNTHKSDIDIVYEMKGNHYLGLDDKLKLEKYLRTKLKRKVDLVRLKYMNPAIRFKAEPDFVYV